MPCPVSSLQEFAGESDRLRDKRHVRCAAALDPRPRAFRWKLCWKQNSPPSPFLQSASSRFPPLLSSGSAQRRPHPFARVVQRLTRDGPSSPPAPVSHLDKRPTEIPDSPGSESAFLLQARPSPGTATRSR